MKASTTFAAISGLVSLASAQNAFGIIAARSASPIHLQSVNASGQAFWIGKPSATYCPSEVVQDCPVDQGETLFAGGNNTLGLSTEVPGGQLVYIEPDCGAVKFTQAHSASMPAGSIVTGWTLDQLQSFGELAWTNGILFCPSDDAGKEVWQMFAALPNVTFAADCLGADLLTVNATGPGAWQYT